MESFSKKYKITPFLLIFMTPLVSILYNVLKLVPEIKKMTAPYAAVFFLLFNLLCVIFIISLLKMIIQVWKNVHDSYQLVLAQKARDMLLVQEKEVEQFQKNIVIRQEEVFKTLEKALTDSRAGDYATLEKRVSQLTEHLQTNHSETFCSNSLLNTILQIKKEKAEQLLLDMGFHQVRVRIHGMMARIEIDPSEFGKLMEEENREKIAKTLKEYGFTYVTLDLMGYRTGSMNETF